jgi:hypothetical protein
MEQRLYIKMLREEDYKAKEIAEALVPHLAPKD